MVALFPDIVPEDTWAQIFMQAGLYGYVLCIGADMIGDGAELLMLCKKWASIVGSIVVPILGALPDGMMVLFSGLGTGAQEQIQVGVGALAGSTVMLLTLPWFISILTGRVTIKDGVPNYKPKPQARLAPIDGGFVAQLRGSLFRSGVSVGEQVKTNAEFMMITTIPYFVIQVPALFLDHKALPSALAGMLHNSPSDDEQRTVEKPFACVGILMCLCFFCFYMVKEFRNTQNEDAPLHKKQVEMTIKAVQDGHLTLQGVMHEFREETQAELNKSGPGEQLSAASLEEGLLKDSESKDSAAHQTVKHMCKVLEPFFKKYDQNGDNSISLVEFRLLMTDLRENVSEDKTKAIFDAADMDKNGGIEFEEFVACIMAFALDPQSAEKNDKFIEETVDEDEDDDEGEDPDEEDETPDDIRDLSVEDQQKAIKRRAFSKMFFGSVLVCFFSDPMVDLLGVMGDKAKIPAFYVSFMIAPLASNASELLAAKKLAQKKTKQTMTQSLSTLCGAAIMNNSFCLSMMFFCFVYGDLRWSFTAETISIVAIQYVIGSVATLTHTQTLFHGCIVLLCYPGAMVIVYMLENFAGLD
jgi:hypothetical protein